MWNKIQSLTQHPVLLFLKKLCGDPVQLYTIMLMTTIMEYYHSGWTWVYTVISVFLTFGLMKFYDFVAAHKYLGPLCYLGFLVGGLFAVSVLVDIGYQDYPIYFLVWFLTPQSVMDFSLWYTIAVYFLMLGFLSSAVYYFGKVRYRMVMQLLIMLIPLSMYAKEGIQMDALLVIILLASYFLLMVYCRQLRSTPDIRRLPSVHTGMSVAVYVTAFSILAAIVPKPAIKADREFIENAMGTSSLSDILMEAISVFTDSTSNSVMLTNNTRTIYYVNAAEPLRLRTQTYTYYLADDSWNKLEDYDYPDRSYTEEDFSQPRMLLQSILDAAEADADFAAKYGLTQYAGTELPEQPVRTMTLVPNIWGSYLLPIPTHTALICEERELPLVQTRQDIVIMEGDTFTYRLPVTLDYYSDTYAHYEAVSRILSDLAAEDYSDLLWDAGSVMREIDHETYELLCSCYYEQYSAQLYLNECMELDFQSDAVDALAQELTEGLDSDYEKARAIERYFWDAGFVYDLSYQKADGENVEDFLLTSKRGVCYEFATAMVLLCRSAGLPARYVQGYSMSETYDGEVSGVDVNYMIKARDAHGFPEVYISGYGWMSFEPTVAMTEEAEEGTAENFYVMLWGFVLLGIALTALAVWLLLPRVREWHFRRKAAKMQPQTAAAAIFRRMRKTLYLPDSATVMELAEASQAFAASMQELYAQLDTLLYAQETDTAVTAEMLTASYTAWQDARTAYEKETRKKEKQR